MEISAAILERILDLAVQIQQVPSPTFGEKQRAEFVRSQFIAMGASEVSLEDSGNVYIRLVGKGKKPPLVITAHLDTVFPADTVLACVRTSDLIAGPGIGDNSLGLAALFGLYWYFSAGNRAGNTSLDGDIWLVANVGEEGLGDLMGMKAVVDRFGMGPLAYIVVEGMSLGQVYTRGLGVRRYRIRVHTHGGHSWVDYGSPSAIHEMASLIVKLSNLVIPAEPRTSLNVGVMSGGTSVNTIAADASLELDLRSESPQQLNHLVELVEDLVSEADAKGAESIRLSAEVVGDRPAGEIPADHALVKTAIECFARQGISVNLNIGSSDANIPLSRGYPAICMGLTTGAGSHTVGEFIETKPLAKGFKVLADLVPSIFRMENSAR
jgi:tripeptide aminopeptidase